MLVDISEWSISTILWSITVFPVSLSKSSFRPVGSESGFECGTRAHLTEDTIISKNSVEMFVELNSCENVGWRIFTPSISAINDDSVVLFILLLSDEFGAVLVDHGQSTTGDIFLDDPRFEFIEPLHDIFWYSSIDFDHCDLENLREFGQEMIEDQAISSSDKEDVFDDSSFSNHLFDMFG